MSDYADYWYTSSDGLRLYARDYPGPRGSLLTPVLCMHGLTRNSADFANLASHLAATRRVISVDQRGRGRSEYDSNAANYTPATYVQDMFALLDQLGLERVIPVGTSMGGLMAFLMASLQPRRLVGMVINDIGPEIDPVGLARIQSYIGNKAPVSTWEEAVAQTREINQVAFPHYTDSEWLAFTRCLYVERDGVPVLAYDPKIAEGMSDPDSGAVPPDLWPLFTAAGEVPMLLVRGALSDILSAACATRMAEVDPDLIVVEVADRGHAPTLDEPEARAAIDDFLATLD